ncbi:hypothetical protein Tco_0748782 [Tanacetum coccineum]|uniref:Uncharacterized protein n=1 Tax=Tanacetum coccineum TaxID=301880 RepID=A0ABQ4YXS3_9ASTR
MTCSLSHNVDEIKAMVRKQIKEDKVRQLAIMNLTVEYDNVSTATDELRNAYEKCNDIPQEKRVLIDDVLKQKSDKDYEMHNALDTIQLESVVSTISHEYLLEFTSEYGIPEGLHPELPNPEDTIVDFLEGKMGVYTRYGIVQPDQCPKSHQGENRDFSPGGTKDQGQNGLLWKIPHVDNPIPTEVAPDLGEGNGHYWAHCKQKALQKGQRGYRGKCTAQGAEEGPLYLPPDTESSEVPSGHMATTEVQDLFSIKSPESGKSASYQPGWGVINTCRQDTPDACQDVAVEVEVHDLRIRTKNLETLLEAEVDMKKAAKAKYTELIKELKSLRVQFSDLQVNNDQLS